MSEVLHANIFFFIASIATIVFCLMVCVILYQVYKIARSIRRIVERIELGSATLAEDVAQVRATLSASSGFVSTLFRSLFGMKMSSTSRRRRSSKQSDVV